MRVAYGDLVKDHHFRMHRLTVGRRRVDDAEVARAHERELQGARNGRGGERERIYRSLALTQLFLCGYAEFLLLIYHQQAEVFKLHVLAKKAMRADDDVHLPFLQLLQSLLFFLRALKAVDVIHGAREILKPFRKCLVVLVGQNGRGYEDGGLLAIHHAS